MKAAGLSNAELDRVAFTTSAGVHGGPLAEFAVFGVLAGAKDLPRLMAHQRERHWGDRWAMRQVSEMTVLVLGLGGIGSQVARKLSSLGAQVIGTSRHNNPVEHVDRVVRVEEVASVLPDVDAVVVTLPGTEATEGLLDDEFFSRVRPGSTLVSVGRGSVIDEDALLAALEDGRVSFAALDVFAQEPLPQTSPLWRHPSVLVSPHGGPQRRRGKTHRRTVRAQRLPVPRRPATAQPCGHRSLLLTSSVRVVGQLAMPPRRAMASDAAK